jgi:hypothetical protein
VETVATETTAAAVAALVAGEVGAQG